MINETANILNVSNSLNKHRLGEQCFEIRPNASMSKKCALLVFLGFLLLSILIMIRFALIGAWLVVPFTIIEITFIGGVLWFVLQENKQLELIYLTADKLKIIKQDKQKQKQWSFNPYWVHVSLESSYHTWYPDRLMIKSHGQSLEIGACLTASERSSLANALNILLMKKKVI